MIRAILKWLGTERPEEGQVEYLFEPEWHRGHPCRIVQGASIYRTRVQLGHDIHVWDRTTGATIKADTILPGDTRRLLAYRVADGEWVRFNAA